MQNEISTYKTFLMDMNDTPKILVDIISFPDLGGAPENIEVTTMSDSMRRYIPGIQNLEPLTFEANYSLTKYNSLKALEENERSYGVWFGGAVSAGVNTPTGEYGKFSFKGRLSVFVNGGGINEAVKMTITIAPSSAIVLEV